MCTGPLTKWSAWTLSTATILALGGCAHDTVETSRQELARTEAQLAPVAAEEEDAEDPTPATESTTAEELPSGSLAQFQAYAVAHSPALRASFERWRAAVELPQQQRALPDPTITYAGFVSAIETRVGPMRHRLGVRQWFPWPTSVTARGDAAAARAVGAQRVFEAHALSLGAEVARAYWKLWSIDQEQQIQIKQVEVLETTKRLAETLVETGAANVSVLARISLRIARHESRLEALKEARARASAKLAFTLGLEEEVGFEIRATIDEPRTLGESVEVLARDLADHPRVASMISESNAESSTARAARGDRAPRVGLGLDWTMIGDPAAPIAGGGRDAVAINVSMSVPIWASGASAKARAARARSRAHRAQAEHIRTRLVADLRVRVTDLRGSARTVATYKDQMLPQAVTAQDSVYGAFEAGRAGVTELLDMHRTLLELRLELVAARYAHEVAWSDLEALVGRPIRERSDDDVR